MLRWGDGVGAVGGGGVDARCMTLAVAALAFKAATGVVRVRRTIGVLAFVSVNISKSGRCAYRAAAVITATGLPGITQCISAACGALVDAKRCYIA